MLRRSRCAAHSRPFLAPSVVRREPSVWVSVSGPSMPSSHARFGLAVSNPALTSGASQAIVMLHAGAPTCRSGRQVPWPVRSPAVLPSLPISRRLLRPQSPFPRLNEVWHVWWMRERGARLASTPSPLGVLSIVNGYPKRTLSRPSGRACCFVFRVPVGYWGTPVGPTPAPRPRRAQPWHDRAAPCGGLRQSPNDPIARRCRRRRERPGLLHRVRRLRSRRIGR
jgi:hypothetical protein